MLDASILGGGWLTSMTRDNCGFVQKESPYIFLIGDCPFICIGTSSMIFSIVDNYFITSQKYSRNAFSFYNLMFMFIAYKL